MILQKPCPPCCVTSDANWPHIHVHSDFYKYSKSQKVAALEQVIIDHGGLEKALRSVIDYLEAGHDIHLTLS